MTGIQVEKIMIDKADFQRLEDKVDTLSGAVGKLILIEGRQTDQGQRIGNVEQQVSGNHSALLTLVNKNFETQQKELVRIESKLDTWIQRGVGAWAVISTLMLIWQLFSKQITGH